MRRVLLAGLCLFFNYSGLLFAQNKTLGVGATTPNPNAALHVESPTGNQGFIMPRLTTAQREAMTGLLTKADQGLMLYDTDLFAIYTWDGVSWKSSSQFAVGNASSTSNGIQATTIGLGSAGKFSINNPATFAHAVYSENNGDSTSAAVHGYHLGNGFGVFGRSAGSKMASAAVYGEHNGTGDAAGAFRITNTASPYSALFGETNGTGPAIYGNQIGLGRGAQFQITNASNSNAAIRSFTSGTGSAGFYTINNTANSSAGIFSTTNGKGAAIFGENTGTGSAAKFIVNNSLSASPVLWAETNSNNSMSAPIYGVHTGLGDGAASFRISNSSNAYAAIYTTTNGQGAALRAENTGAGNGFAATFDVTNAANQFPAVQVSSAGAGSGVRVMQPSGTGAGVDVFMQNPTSPASGLAVDQGGAGHGGSFIISNASNNSHAVQAITKANGSAGEFITANTLNTAPTISTSHDGNGIAFAIWRGGVQVTTMDVTTLVISTRASAYRVLVAGNLSLGFTPSGGEVFMLYNESGQAITFTASGITHTLQNGEGKTFISFGNGEVRGF